MDRRARVRGRRRSGAAEVLLPRDVRVPVRARARRPRPQLHHRRHHGAHEADARLQRAASVRLGRVRAAGGKRRHQDRHASRDVDARQHRPHERAAAAARDQLRVGTRDRHVSARLLQVQPVDLPEDVRARAGVPQALDRQLVSEGQHRARQRAGDRRRLLALRHADRDARSRAVVLQDHRLRRRAAQGTRHADRVARKSRRHAAQLDRAIRRRPDQVSDRRRQRWPVRGDLHDPHRHDLRRDVRLLAPEHALVDRFAAESAGSQGVSRPGRRISRARSRGAADRRHREGRLRYRADGRQSVHRTRRCRSGSRTSCWPSTARAPSWRCRRTTSATSSSPANTTCRSASSSAAGDDTTPADEHDACDDQLRTAGRFGRVHRPGRAGRHPADDCRRREARHRHRRGAVPPQGLGHFAPALLGHADSRHLLREGRRRRRAVRATAGRTAEGDDVHRPRRFAAGAGARSS